MCLIVTNSENGRPRRLGICVRKSSNVNVISKLKDQNGNITSDPAIIANIFNKYFVNVSRDITRNLSISNKSPVNFMADKNGNSFFTAPSTPYEISDIISTLKSGKSLGPNSIPMNSKISFFTDIFSTFSNYQ